MSVGEVIALLTKYASEEDRFLMAKDIYSIDVDENGISLYFTDANTENYKIEADKGDEE